MPGLHLTEDDLLTAGGNVDLSFNESTGEYVFDVDTENVSAAGTDGEVQFNDGGTIGADSGLSYDVGDQTLSASGGVDVAEGSSYTFGGGSIEGLFITEANGTSNVAIGTYARDMIDLAVTAEAEQNVVIGNLGTATTFSGGANTIIASDGPSEITTDYNTYIGAGTGGGSHSQTTYGRNTYIGSFAGFDSGDVRDGIFIGVSAGSGYNSSSNIGKPWNHVAIGNFAMQNAQGQQNVAIGTGSMFDFPGGSANTFIGNFSGQSRGDYEQLNVSESIVLGDEAFATADNQLVFGAPKDKAPAQTIIEDVYIGRGVEAKNPSDITIRSTRAHVIEPNASLGVSGKNAVKAGSDIVLRPGEGSGDAPGSALVVKTASSDGVGDYELQPVVERLTVSETGIRLKNTPVFMGEVEEAGVVDQVLVRDNSTGKIQRVPVSDITSSAVADVKGGQNIATAFNPSTGETIISATASAPDTAVQYNDGGSFAGSSNFTFGGNVLTAPALTLSSQTTGNASGGIQVRNESTGELITIQGTGNTATAARYEGSGAFTFGRRGGSVGANSVVLGGTGTAPNFANGANAIAVNTGTSAAGASSFAAGTNTLASGEASVTTGTNTEATAAQSFAAGSFTLASADQAVAFGQQTEASGVAAVAGGRESTASGNQSVAIGFEAEATGTRSVAFGRSVTASGDYSFAANISTVASGNRSVALGQNTEAANNSSFATGNASQANADYAFAAGDNVRTSTYSAAVVGAANELISGTPGSEPGSDERMFVVGVGDSLLSDTRGRVDGLYVTYRDGTHVRHGLALDAYNSTSETYETELRIPKRIQPGTDTSQVLVRNPATNELEYVSGDVLVSASVNVAGGTSISTFYNASTDEFTVNLDPGSEDVAAGFGFIKPSGELIENSEITYEGNGAVTFGGRSGTIGDSSFTIGSFNEASGFGSVAFGIFNDSTGESSFTQGTNVKATAPNATAFGRFTEATNNVAAAFGGFTLASGFASLAAGSETVASGLGALATGSFTRAGFHGGAAVGNYNEDVGTEPGTISGIAASDRVLQVGAGGNPSASAGDNDYFDGRGRVDSLYVTYRDGTHVRHGLSVDSYNESLGQYETVFEVDENGTIVQGDVGAPEVAGSDTQILFNDGGSFGASENLTYSNNKLTISDGSISFGNDGIFMGLLNDATKVNFSSAPITSKSDIPASPLGRTTVGIQSTSKINIEENEDFGEAGAFLNSVLTQEVTAENSQEYVDFLDAGIGISALTANSLVRNIRGTNAEIYNRNGSILIGGDNTEITDESVVAETKSRIELENVNTIKQMANVDIDNGFFYSDFASGFVETLYGIYIQDDSEVDFSKLSIENAYGIFQESPWMDNVFAGTVTQSSGDLVLAKDNRKFEAELNQRTTTGAEAVLAKDSQGRNLKPEIPENGTWHFEANVTARVVGSSNSLAMEGDTHVWKVEGVASSTFNESLGQRDVRFVGNPSVVTVATDIPTQDYSVSVNINGQGELEIAVQGNSGDTVHWMASLDVEELSQ